MVWTSSLLVVSLTEMVEKQYTASLMSCGFPFVILVLLLIIATWWILTNEPVNDYEVLAGAVMDDLSWIVAESHS